MLRIERQWAQFDGVALHENGSVAVYVAVKGPTAPTIAETASAIESFELERRPPGTVVAEPAHLPLRELFKAYAKEAELAPSTVKRWTPVMERLISHLDHDDARDFAHRRSRLERRAAPWGLANITVRDVYVAAAKATLQFGQCNAATSPAASIYNPDPLANTLNLYTAADDPAQAPPAPPPPPALCKRNRAGQSGVSAKKHATNLIVARGPWVRPSPGIPCALLTERDMHDRSLGRTSRRENAAGHGFAFIHS
jgi:hypothetical protein